MNAIQFDFSASKGKMKAMHGVGQPPMMGAGTEYMHYLSEAGIPYSRLHDVGGRYGGFVYVDIPNIFRDFNADENNPESYDFAFTDILMASLREQNCEAIYRLGVTIENDHKIKAYRVFPPSDPAKWARICEHIIRHYNEGWADGFTYGITYWEVWNEPEGGALWQGTREQFFELYEVTARHLKACFKDSIKIGGFGAFGFFAVTAEPSKYGFNLPDTREAGEWRHSCVTFIIEFLKFVKEKQVPIDFFSWHSYMSVKVVEFEADFCQSLLEKYGLTHIEVHLNEWNNARKKEVRGTSYASANAAAMMCSMQNKNVDILNYYDARIGQSVYGGLFNPITYEPFCTYYVFKAFNDLYRLGTQMEAKYEEEELYALAAADGDKKAVLITNIGADKEITTNLSADMKAYLIDEEHYMTEVALEPTKFVLQENTVVLWKNF